MSDNPKAASKIDPLAEFHRLKEETAVINAKMRASAPLLNSSVSSSDALLGIILKELKAMRVEVNRIEENQKKQEKMQEYIAEKHEQLHEELREVKEAQKQSESRITENQKTMMLKMDKIQKDVTSNEKNLKTIDSKIDEGVKKSAVSEEPIQLDIKDKIYGKWRNIDNSNLYYSYKIEGNKFFERYRDCQVKEYTLGVEHSDGRTVTVENDKIIQKWIHNGEEIDRYEFFLEDGKLVKKYFYNGKFQSKYVYERVGDPEFD